MNAEELLARAKAVYERADTAYRDALLECGRLLHQFIRAYLEPGDGMGEVERLRRRITRRAAVELASEALVVPFARIKELIVAAMAADLLGDGSDLGRIGHSTVCRFKCFVRRRVGGRQDYKMRHGIAKVSDSEAWEVKPQLGEQARALFRAAVGEGWTQQRAYRECVTLCRGDSPPKKRVKPPGKSGDNPGTVLERFKLSMHEASPGDVAETCLELIERSADPAAVAVRLRVMLQRYLPKKAGRTAV